MEKKGQGALEYLLLIGGAVLIAVIVIAVITGLANTTSSSTNTQALCATLSCDTCKANTSCVGMNSGVGGAAATPVTWEAGTGCTATDRANFTFCKAA